MPDIVGRSRLINEATGIPVRLRLADNGDGTYSHTVVSTASGVAVTTMKTALATASGDTALWTPASGKKVRVMRVMVQLTGQATQATAGNVEVILRDGTTPLPIGCSFYVPQTPLNQFGFVTSGWMDFGNGWLLSTNGVLNVNLSAALTAGEVRVVVAGTEE